MLYTIVKFSQDGFWKHHFLNDPKRGVHISHSAYNSYSGRVSGVKLSYELYKEAVRDCRILNQVNPSGYYDVCIVCEE